MNRASDLIQLKRLIALCDAQHRLAVQEQVHAEDHATMATRRRTESEAAVSEAEQAWQRALSSGMLGPDLAAVAGDMLIVRAGALAASLDREAEARRQLAECEEARGHAQARVRQVEAVTASCRQEMLRRRDERQLAEIEDRTAYRWRRA